MILRLILVFAFIHFSLIAFNNNLHFLVIKQILPFLCIFYIFTFGLKVCVFFKSYIGLHTRISFAHTV